MSNGKRILSLLLVLVLCFALMPQVFAAETYTEYDVYVERPAAEAGNAFYHGAKYEPKTGSYLALFAEGDAAMHDWNEPNYTGWYFGRVPQITGKDHAAYMVYVHYDEADAISHYASHYRAAKQLGKAMQICLEPLNGLDEVQNDAHLVDLAKQANAAGIPIFLRFASEFNDDSGGNPWNKDGAQKYIEKFRLVANVFHQYAPNCAMVWAPNDWPIGSEDAYYPGDEYVDWIGVSSYQVFNPDGTPKQGDTWMDRFHLLYEKYGSRKPIFITEGASVPSVENHPQQSVTDAARYELLRFYAGAARRYPNLKMIFYWSENEGWGRQIQCELSANSAMLAAYKSAIADPYYLGNFNTSSDIYYQKVSGTTLRETEKLSCYVNDVNNRVAKAVYYVNNKYVGEGYFPDYSANVNLASYVGRKVELRADFYAENGAYLTSRSYSVNVVTSNPTAGFVDVYAKAFFAKHVAWAAETGVTAGVDKTHFNPYGKCTRGQIVTFLWRAAGKPAASATTTNFTDVIPGKYYYKAVLWAVENGITTGTSATTFEPDATCNRGQAVTFLWRAKGKPAAQAQTTAFTDVKTNGFYYKAVLWAVENNVTSGTTNTTFEPNADCTRGQIVTFLSRAYNIT